MIAALREFNANFNCVTEWNGFNACSVERCVCFRVKPKTSNSYTAFCSSHQFKFTTSCARVRVSFGTSLRYDCATEKYAELLPVPRVPVLLATPITSLPAHIICGYLREYRFDFQQFGSLLADAFQFKNTIITDLIHPFYGPRITCYFMRTYDPRVIDGLGRFLPVVASEKGSVVTFSFGESDWDEDGFITGHIDATMDAAE